MQVPNSVIHTVLLGLLLAGVQTTQAAGLNEEDQAQLVPYASYTTGGPGTVVGLLPTHNGTVYWGFFDTNGNRQHGGSLAVEAERLYGFDWSSEAASAPMDLSGMPGYLFFAIDTDGNGQVDGGDSNALGANAFHVDLASADVIYLPTVDVDGNDLSNPSPSNWSNNPITGLDTTDGKTLDNGDTVDLQFAIDGAPGGDDTLIFVWSSGRLPSTTAKTLHDGAGASKPITVPLLNDHLNIVNLEKNPGLTSAFYGAGFVRWTVPPSVTGGNVDLYVFSVAFSDLFQAAQTLLGNYEE